jgi:hypothetical protein
MRAPFVGLEFADLQACAAERRFDPATLEAVSGAMSADGRARIARLNAALEVALACIDELPPRTVLETFWLDCAGADAYTGGGHITNALRLFELVDQLGPLGLDPDELQEAVAGLYALDSQTTALQIMTIHRAKGLEFDHVLLPFLDRTTRSADRLAMYWRSHEGELLAAAATTAGGSGLYEWLRREERTREREETKRLLYVACTRARSGLYLSAVAPTTRAATGSLLELVADEFNALTVESASTIREQIARAEPGRLAAHVRTIEDERSRLSIEQRPLARRDSPSLGGPIGAFATLIREQLHRASRIDAPDRTRDWNVHALRRRLEDLGVIGESCVRLANLAAAQLAGVLEDETGRWILAPRAQVACDWRLTGIDDGQLVDVIVDRSFVVDGVRWIIDYATATPTGSVDEFVATARDTDAPRLARNARFARALQEGGVEVRAGIYFTAIPRFVPLDDTGSDGYHRRP